MHINNENTHIGKDFELAVQNRFQQEYGCVFIREKKIAIGSPAKEHRFDLVDNDCNGDIVEMIPDITKEENDD